jgi:hypothetical protein
VETSISRPRRRVLTAAAGLVAVGLLAAMVVSGQLRESKQFVRFVPSGVMPEEPKDIDRVELNAGARRWAFVRGSGGWRSTGGEPAPAALAAHLDDSIKFMHVSAPIRVMERAEWSAVGLREFGLDPPGYSATLFRKDEVVLAAAFGTPNPQKVLQYMKLERREQVYLMARFVGEEWEKVIGEAARR